MKLVTCIALLTFSTSLLAQTQVHIDDLIGVYDLKALKQVPYLEAGMTVEYRLGISSKKDALGDNIIGLNEIYKQKLEDGTEIFLSEVKCEGTASIGADSVMNTSVKCENDSSFDQKLTFKNVSDLKAGEFTASVFSSVSGQAVDMVLKKFN